ncbi:hypothetical protein NQ317_009354 [Molorchus minor]|uniref:CCHC-type domain-containing protein n=1 Tax=Molorchus minor TaxID=1323400 RepID=A0ABQ9JLU2_9CUCU|nr:hypothetical protein NQ317_009354 [Molorchus minor]
MSTQPINIVQSVLENNYKHSLKTIDTGWLERTSSDIIDESDDEAPTKDLFHLAKKRKVENNVEATRKATIKCSGSAISQCSVEKDDGEKKQTGIASIQRLYLIVILLHLIAQIQMHVDKRKQADTTNEKVKESGHRDDKFENKCNTFTDEKLEEAVKSVASKDTEMTKPRKFRTNKSKPEFTSEEEDAFHTDTDEKDPEFSLDSHKIKWKDAIYDFDESTEMSKNTYDTTAKSPPKKSARKKEKVVKTKVDDEPEENKPYELEFSIKPRTVAPRIGRVSKPKRLSGLDMDMGGCDGGMLTCFSCGQIGHFSRNCKGLNGDGLLPLVADQEEECPYPTLEEASQMARDKRFSC